MRDFVDSRQFCDSVERISKNWTRERSIDLRNDVVDNSNFHVDKTMFFNLKQINLRDFIRLSIVSWYFPEEIRVVLQSDLREAQSKFSSEDKFLLEQFLLSEAEMLCFLLETRLWHSRDFFGNLLKDFRELNKYLKVKNFRKKVVVPQRKRGYHDQGSRVEDHRWLPKKDYSLTEEQNRIEENRVRHGDTIEFLRGFLN